eukprot:5319584-Amphidinium_carterae.1
MVPPLPPEAHRILDTVRSSNQTQACGRTPQTSGRKYHGIGVDQLSMPRTICQMITWRNDKHN